MGKRKNKFMGERRSSARIKNLKKTNEEPLHEEVINLLSIVHRNSPASDIDPIEFDFKRRKVDKVTPTLQQSSVETKGPLASTSAAASIQRKQVLIKYECSEGEIYNAYIPVEETEDPLATNSLIVNNDGEEQMVEDRINQIVLLNDSSGETNPLASTSNNVKRDDLIIKDESGMVEFGDSSLCSNEMLHPLVSTSVAEITVDKQIVKNEPAVTDVVDDDDIEIICEKTAVVDKIFIDLSHDENNKLANQVCLEDKNSVSENQILIESKRSQNIDKVIEEVIRMGNNVVDSEAAVEGNKTNKTPKKSSSGHFENLIAHSSLDVRDESNEKGAWGCMEGNLLNVEQIRQLLHHNVEQPTDPLDSDEELADLDDIFTSSSEHLYLNTERHLRDFLDDDDNSCSDKKVTKHGSTVLGSDEIINSGTSPDEIWLTSEKDSDSERNVTSQLPFTGTKPGAYVPVKVPPSSTCADQNGERKINNPAVNQSSAAEYQPDPVIYRQSPYSVFMLYFQKILHIVTEETNKYWQRNSKKLFGLERFTKFVTIDQMRRFFAIIIEMCHTVRPSLTDYWLSNEMNKIPWYERTFPRGCREHIFSFIFRDLHFTNEDPPTKEVQSNGNFDRFWKLRKILNIANRISRKYYKPDRNLALGEAASVFKNGVIFKPSVLKRWKRRGIRLSKLVDSSGYTVSLSVYSNTKEPVDDNLPIIERSVLDMFSGLQNKGYHVYMDKSFTSVSLFRKLRDIGVLCCGTAENSCCDIPSEFRKSSRDVHEAETNEPAFKMTRDRIICAQFKKDKLITLLSTIHNASRDTIQSSVPDDMNKAVLPSILSDYENNLRSVDNSNSLLSCFTVRDRTNNWTKKLFFYIFDTLLLNAYITYRSVNRIDSAIHYKWFRDSVVQGFIMAAPTGAPAARFRFLSDNVCDDLELPKRMQGCEGRHFLWRFGEGSYKCVVCNLNNSRSGLTMWYCLVCEVPLCPQYCFEAFHTKEKLIIRSK